ncbi:MAG: hypothetical protein ACXVDB_02135 [Tumebacillaceae bacterium]
MAVWITLLLVTGCSMPGTMPSASNPANHAVVSFTAKEAIAKVLPQHPDFPATVSKQNIRRTGIGAPGSVINGTIQTECQMIGPSTYRVIFTKDWNTIVNETPAKSRWEYEVTPIEVHLLHAEDHADVINRMK